MSFRAATSSCISLQGCIVTHLRFMWPFLEHFPVSFGQILKNLHFLWDISKTMSLWPETSTGLTQKRFFILLIVVPRLRCPCNVIYCREGVFFLSIQIKVYDLSVSFQLPLTQTQIYQNVCFREDVASSSTFTLEDSAICLTSEQSTMDVDIDRDDGSVLDVYLVSWFWWRWLIDWLIDDFRDCSSNHADNRLNGGTTSLSSAPQWRVASRPSFPPANHTTITPLDGPSRPSLPMLLDPFCHLYCQRVEVLVVLGLQEDTMDMQELWQIL